MSCLIHIASSNISYVAIFIYAPAKKEFWSELIAYALSPQLPYVILAIYARDACLTFLEHNL